MDGLQCLTLRTLNKNITNAVIIAVIIRSQDVKVFSSKKDSSEKGVWNFTLRDSLTDYINVTCWGSSGYIQHLKEKFGVGDIVDVMRPKINVRQIDDISEKYRPSVTSPYSLTLNEEQSSIILHEGDNFHEFIPLLHYPTKPIASCITLADIYHNGSTFRGENVDLLVAVQHVGSIKKVNAKSDGRELTNRDVTFLDRTHSGLRVTFWEDEFINRAQNWKMRETILFLADMRVDWSNFERSMVAVPNSKTIITEDPLVPQAEALREFARTVPIHPLSLVDRIASKIPDPSTITTVMNCKQVMDLATGTEPVENNQFTALLYAFVSELDLDGFIPMVIKRCERCNELINKQVNTCVNLECPVGSGAERGNPQSQFNVRMSLSDNTGSLVKCRLVGKIAERILGVTANDFDQMSDDDKEKLKWIYLLQNCEVRIVVLKDENRPLYISIVDCKLAEMSKVAAKLPVLNSVLFIVASMLLKTKEDLHYDYLDSR